MQRGEVEQSGEFHRIKIGKYQWFSEGSGGAISSHPQYTEWYVRERCPDILVF